MRRIGRAGVAALSRPPSLVSRAIRRACIAYFELSGWRIEGGPPDLPKFVIAGAPHTSNWDFVIFLAATEKVGVRPSFLGKHSLFRWPLKRLMEDMGGIPINRSKRANYVDQVVEVFAQRDALALVIGPEGTRHTDGRWKSGFYHIALGAGVPIVPVWLNLGLRRLKLGEPLWPTGDWPADMARLQAFYRAAEPGNPRFERMIDEQFPSRQRRARPRR